MRGGGLHRARVAGRLAPGGAAEPRRRRLITPHGAPADPSTDLAAATAAGCWGVRRGRRLRRAGQCEGGALERRGVDGCGARHAQIPAPRGGAPRRCHAGMEGIAAGGSHDGREPARELARSLGVAFRSGDGRRPSPCHALGPDSDGAGRSHRVRASRHAV